MTFECVKSPGLAGHCLAWFFGALFPLAFAPFDLTPLAWFSVITYAISIDTLSPKQAAIRSWFYGFGLYAVGVSWVYVSMHDYGYTPAWLAIPLMIIFTAGLGLLFMFQGYFYRRLNLNHIVIIGLPATWIMFEWVKTWLFSGFPWLFLGTSQIDNPMGGYLPVVGVFGTGFMTILCCAFWVYCLQQFNSHQLNIQPSISKQTSSKQVTSKQASSKQASSKQVSSKQVSSKQAKKKKPPVSSKQDHEMAPSFFINKPLALGALVTTITVLSIGHTLKNHSWITIQQNDPINVSVVQGNISQDRKWLPEELNKTKKLFKTMTIAEWSTTDEISNQDSYKEKSDPQKKSLQPEPWHADVVIWPEAAIPQFHDEARDYLDEMDSLALKNNSTLISGILFLKLKPKSKSYFFHNGIFAIGHGEGVYYKQKLVPFGEYIPLGDLIRGLIPFFDLPMSNISPGEKEQAPLKVKDTLFAPFICYEIVYPEFVRRYAKEADVLITISNDAWFGTSHGPHQHFQMARVRAAENGKYLIRGTNTGITAIVGPYGNVLARAPQEETTTLRGTVYRTTGETPYSQIGTGILMDICFVLLAIVWAFGRSKKRAEPQA